MMAFFLNSCDNSTGSDDTNLLVGEWEMTSIVITIDNNVAVTIPADDDNNGIMILNSDGIYILDGELDGDNTSENGTWSSTETKITFIVDSDSSGPRLVFAEMYVLTCSSGQFSLETP